MVYKREFPKCFALLDKKREECRSNTIPNADIIRLIRSFSSAALNFNQVCTLQQLVVIHTNFLSKVMEFLKNHHQTILKHIKLAIQKYNIHRGLTYDRYSWFSSSSTAIPTDSPETKEIQREDSFSDDKKCFILFINKQNQLNIFLIILCYSIGLNEINSCFSKSSECYWTCCDLHRYHWHFNWPEAMRYQQFSCYLHCTLQVNIIESILNFLNISIF